MTEQEKKDILDGASHPELTKSIPYLWSRLSKKSFIRDWKNESQWEDIPDTYDKPKLCRIDDPECTSCE